MSVINFKINIDDKGIFKELAKQSGTLFVGFWEDTYPDGTPVATVAARNEYGGGHTPPRPFMRYTAKSRAKKWRNIVRDKLPQYMNVKKTLGDLGDVAQEDLMDVIRIWTRPPNAESTIKRKGKNDPLVDTGRMMKSVRIEVK